MKTRTKLILSCFIMLLGSIFSLFFTASMNEILAKQSNVLRIIPFNDCITMIAADKKCLLLFLCFEGFFLMLCLLLITTNTKPYRSSLITITPDIKIPAPVGQYQHGSAKFLNDKEKDNAFESFIIDPYQKLIKNLIKTGYEDLDFMKGRNETSPNSQSLNNENPQSKESVITKENIPKVKNDTAPTEHIKSDFTATDNQTSKGEAGKQKD